MFHYYFSEFEYYINDIIITSFRYISFLYVFLKTLNLRLLVNYTKKQVAFLALSGVAISLLHAILYSNYPELAQLLVYLLTAISITIVTKNKEKSVLIISLITQSFVFVLSLASSFIIGTIGWILHLPPQNVFTYLFIEINTFLLAYFILKSKRLRNGFQFFKRKENLGLGLIISGITFVVISVDFNNDYISDILLSIFFIGGIITCFGLYLWIRKGITKHYREKLQLKSELYYKEQLEQKEQEIEKLNHSNEYLAKIVHRDNHLMSSLNSSINAYFESGDKEFKDNILREIQTLENERAELINSEQISSKILPSTGNSLIDGAINNLYIKAAAHGIDFNLSVSATVDEVIGKYISQTDLQTLICDHIKDAIIAVDAKNENNGKILVELSMENDNYTITIFDSGVDFEIDTLAKLGKERVTTHADNGGSGIGFMTTFETLRKSYASLIITEFANKTPFSKSVSIRFDGNTAFILQSYRKEELQSALNRDDVILL